MANPLSKIMSNPVLQARLLRLQVVVMGLALDFWKDTPFPKKEKKPVVAKPAPVPLSGAQNENAQVVKKESPSIKSKYWIADRIQIMEKLWGEGNIFPGDKEYVSNLVAPLGLNQETSVLDLSAGLGGLARKLAVDYNVYVTGLEPNPVLASRGMLMSIAAGKSKQASITAYDPAAYEASKKYDCVFARELFCRVIGKEKFFNAVASSVKPKGGQIVFTDYILEDKDMDKKAIVQWLSVEKDVVPLSYAKMVQEWKGLKFDMRVAEDQTDLYRREVLRGLSRFVAYLAKHKPSPDTKPLIVHEIDLWSRRVAAIENGLKYYRFYGIKR